MLKKRILKIVKSNNPQEVIKSSKKLNIIIFSLLHST